MKIQTVCFWQIYRTKPMEIKDGHGDCSVCTASPDNQYCIGYTPIKFRVFEVVEEEEVDEE